ncbi:uncharacterized protein LOC128869895 [Anastrepha ludens]|uniref:uncharacterized protein LOC128869894 n=1 Tax=Anastrepha ludens TaxID=28586 RepID=UPI0023AFC310|nr:uncharacterized protein LOC128869894 [Anastrepha ludens]XP_053968467.1 uncharacterized protein LOC128869895 [Anastrepha ludens]
MIKLNSLRVDQINKLLQNQGATIMGNKAAKILKLTEIYGADEVDAEELEVSSEVTAMQKQMEEMRGIIAGLAKSVNDLVTVQIRQTLTPSNATTIPAEVSCHDNRSTATIEAHAEIPRSSSQHDISSTPIAVDRPLLVPTTQSEWKRSAVHDIIALLPDFDPLKGSLTSKQFVDKVIQLREAYEWSEQEILLAAQSKLKGVAKEWLDAQTVFQRWSAFVSAFQTDFPFTMCTAEVHMELSRRKRRTSETMSQYYYTMLNIGRRGKVDEESINTYIIRGLNDSNLTRTLLAMKLSTCNDLLRSLDSLADVYCAFKGTDIGNRNVNEVTRNVTTEKKSIKCFNCNEYGHIAANCPKPPRKERCAKCNKVGHDSKSCRYEKSTVATVVTENLYPPLLSSVLLNGDQYSAFIDTGSDTSLISESKVPTNAEKKVCVRKLEGFGGASVESKEEIEVNLVIEGIALNTKLQIVPDEFMPYDLFIGRDVLCQKDCSLVIQSGNMQIQKNTANGFNVDVSLSKDEMHEVLHLLEKYDDCFAEDLGKLGRCKTTTMEILVSTEKPITGRQYQVPFIQRPVLSTIIDDLLKHNIIRQSSSPYAAPVVIVKKSNGEGRMCVDFRALNAVTIKKQFPMPIVEEQLSKLGGNTFSPPLI